MCGNCCRYLHKVSFLSEYNTGNGICKHLANNLCNIYDERPLICNVEKMYTAYFNAKMTEKQFILTNLLSCKEIAAQFDDAQSSQKIDELLKNLQNQ
jgi:Fe-S-cluster containining protein